MRILFEHDDLTYNLIIPRTSGSNPVTLFRGRLKSLTFAV